MAGPAPDERPIMKLKLALLCVLGIASANAMACYTVYDKSNRVVYSGTRAPVDMSLQIHETLPRVAPGGHMVFDAGSDCPATLGASAGSTSPLLTDRSTAER